MEEKGKKSVEEFNKSIKDSQEYHEKIQTNKWRKQFK